MPCSFKSISHPRIESIANKLSPCWSWNKIFRMNFQKILKFWLCSKMVVLLKNGRLAQKFVILSKIRVNGLKMIVLDKKWIYFLNDQKLFEAKFQIFLNIEKFWFRKSCFSYLGFVTNRSFKILKCRILKFSRFFTVF